MGTSKSSAGPASNVPMVPPWVPDIDDEDVPADENDGSAEESDSDVQESVNAQIPEDLTAPPARFRDTRRHLGSYSQSGNVESLRRSLGHYVRNGYGGAGVASRRFAGTASAAQALSGALAGTSGTASDRIDRPLLTGASAHEVMDAIVDAVRPIDGSQDAEASRASVRDALSEVLTRFPDADLLNLSPDQQVLAVERYTANDVVRRFELDVGKTVLDKSPTVTAALARMKQIRDFVRQAVAASFRHLQDSGSSLTTGRVDRIVKQALQRTFRVFEDYIE